MVRTVENFTSRVSPELHNEASPVSGITNHELFEAINCKGVQDVFNIKSLRNGSLPRESLNPKTGALEWVEHGSIRGKDGREYPVVFTTDLDNRAISIIREGDEGNLTLLRLNLRDRRHDGKSESTPPNFLEEADIPKRSRYLGGTLWNYNNPQDAELPDRNSVEISRISSDPGNIIFDRLKQDKSQEDAKKLADFIDDPFAALPLKDPSSEKMTEWYGRWWQVVRERLDGKRIAYPGQTSEKGFDGFSPYVLDSLPKLIQNFGYTHISSVPTWLYVWGMNLASGFSPDNEAQHKEALNFLSRLKKIKVPLIKEGKMQEVILGSLSEKDPILSWISLVPFALQLNPNFNPRLSLRNSEHEVFDDVLFSIRENLVFPDGGVATYPLYLDRNLWHSKGV